MTLFGTRVFADVVKVKDLEINDWCLSKGEEREIGGVEGKAKGTHEGKYRGRDLSDGLTR